MSLQIPKNIDLIFRKNKSTNTYNTYICMLSKLFKEVFNTIKFDINKLEEKDKINTYLQTLSLTSKKLITIATVMLLKAAGGNQNLINYYGVLARSYRIEDKQLRKHREATVQEKINHITWTWVKLMKKEYKTFLDNVDKSNLTDKAYKRLFMGYVVFELLTDIPPQRGEVLFNCYVNRDVAGSNMIDLSKKEWIIRESKTKKSYGIRRIPLTDKLVNIIKDWMTISNCKGKLLICNDEGGKMSTQSYTQFLNKTLFRTQASRFVSTDDLRKSYVTHMIVHEGINEEERDTIAKILGHSVQTMMELYFKPDLEDNILLGGSLYIHI